MRLDAFLQGEYPEYSRSLIQKLIKDGHVTVGGVVTDKPKQLVKQNQKVVVDTSRLTAELPKLELKVLYEDDDCVVVDKPLGLLTHSKGAYNPEPTVATWLLHHISTVCKDGPCKCGKGDVISLREGIVHRLDRATSGVMICAKNKQALGKLQKQFQTRKAKKTYIALTSGVPEPKHANLDLPIERNPKRPQTFRVGPNGKSAQTEYKVLKIFNNGQAMVELKPFTGRTHQLRVHLAYIKCPIIGDELYGGPKADRMYLHATALEITLPNSERMTFESKPPKEFGNENE